MAKAVGCCHNEWMASPTSNRTTREDDAFADVPPSVVCAVCGRATCHGCAPVGEDGRIASAVVAIVRPGDASLAGLLLEVTKHPAAFVRRMDRRTTAQVLSFALACETLAAAQVSVGFAALLRSLLGPAHGPTLAIAVAGATMVLTVVLLLGHALWGLAVHRDDRARALRFGLATCAWDLAVSPLGVVLLAPRVGGELASLVRRAAIGLPSATAGAFLDELGVDDPGERAVSKRRSLVAAALGTAVGALVAVAALGAVVMAWVP